MHQPVSVYHYAWNLNKLTLLLLSRRFDTLDQDMQNIKEDKFAYHQKELFREYSGEHIWTPELQTSGRIRSWDNGEIKFQSLKADKEKYEEEEYSTAPGLLEGDVSWRERCFKLVEISSDTEGYGENTTKHLLFIKHDYLNGKLIGECPVKQQLRCEIQDVNKAQEFVNHGRLYKAQTLNSTSVSLTLADDHTQQREATVLRLL